MKKSLLNKGSKIKLLPYAWSYFRSTISLKDSLTEIPISWIYKLTWALFGWNICRKSNFPSHCLSGRLLYESSIVPKLKVLGLALIGMREGTFLPLSLLDRTWISIKNFQTFLKVKIDINRVDMTRSLKMPLCGAKDEYFSYFHSSCQLGLTTKVII